MGYNCIGSYWGNKKFFLEKKKKMKKKFNIPSLLYPLSYLSTNVNKIIPRLEILGVFSSV